jgi:MFS family permease
LSRSFWRAAALAIIVTTCGTLPVFLVAGVAVQVRADLGLPIGHIGIFSAVYFGASALTSSWAGRLIERTGAPLAMRATTLLAGVALAGIGLAPNEAALVGFLALGGCAGAAGQVASNLYLATETHPSRQGLAFGIKQSAIPAATLLGGLAVPLVALTLGWRWAFAAGTALAWGVAATIRSPGPRRAGFKATPARRPDAPLVALIVMSAGGGLASSAANSLGTFLVDSTVAAGIQEAHAGILAAIGSACGLSTRIGAGWFADRARGGRLLWVSSLLAAGALGYAAMATRDTALLVPATLVCFIGGWGWPGLFNFSIVLRNRGAPAAATGVTQTGVYLGGVLGPLLFGQVAQHISYATAWWMNAAMAAAGSVSIIVGRHLLLASTSPPHEVSA